LSVGSAAPADVGVGSHLGKYEIIKRLATGGMAEIFLARVSGLPGFQKMVVIKRILPQLATKTDFVEMFLDEARIAATLQHPNVVQMYDVGVVDGNYFIAMEYLHGEDVRSLMKTLFRREMKMPLEHALNIVIGVASGLHYAHEKVGFDGKPLEIVHRDVTPQNIIVTYDGAVKLLDFGIAKASNRFGETRFGTLKGKVPYMSPEQCRGEPLDRRSDIFSLGIMLYELTLGKRLYEGKSDFEVLKQIVEGTVTLPHELDPSYPPELEAICMRALDKEKDKRYRTAREMQAELEALVRADRMHVSPIALTTFMEDVFGQKIEAWREAQAQGKSLGEHLETIPVGPEVALQDDDLLAVGETEARQQEEIARERAEFRKKVEAGVSGVRDISLDVVTRSFGPDETSVPRPIVPVRSNAGLWLVLISMVVAGAGAVGFVLHSRGARDAAVRTAVAPAVTAPVTAVAPPAQEAPPSVEATGEAAKPSLADAAKAAADAAAKAKAHRAKHVPIAGAATKPSPLAKIQTGEPRKEEPAAKLEGEGTLVLATSPWCNVKIDGADKGPTPLRIKLPAGKHIVVLTNPEFKINRTLPVMILPNETTRKPLDFTQ
jgi:tRNA A-37 threonylcarbamoyl transferase component Bud32